MQKVAKTYLETEGKSQAVLDIDAMLAQVVLDKALENPLDPKWGGYGPTLSRISGTYAEAGNLEKALQVAYSIESERGKALALRDVVNGLVAKGKFQSALEVADSIQEPDIRARSSVVVGRALLERGQVDSGREVIEEAFGLALSFFDESQANLEAATAQAEVDRSLGKLVDGALVLASVYVALSEAGPDPSLEEGRAKELEENLREGLRITLAGAVDLASLIENPTRRALVLLNTAREYWDSGMGSSAAEVLRLATEVTYSVDPHCDTCSSFRLLLSMQRLVTLQPLRT